MSHWSGTYRYILIFKLQLEHTSCRSPKSPFFQDRLTPELLLDSGRCSNTGNYYHDKPAELIIATTELRPWAVFSCSASWLLPSARLERAWCRMSPGALLLDFRCKSDSQDYVAIKLIITLLHPNSSTWIEAGGIPPGPRFISMAFGAGLSVNDLE